MNLPLLLLPICSLNNWQIALGLLIPFILGYLLRQVLNSGKKSLEQELEKTQKDLQISESKNASLKEEFDNSVQTQKNLNQSEILNLHTRISELENAKAGLQVELAKAHDNLLSFTGPQIEDLQVKLGHSENSRNLLKSELENLQNHKTQLENQIASLSTVHEQFANIQNEHEKLKSDYHQILLEKEKSQSETTGNEMISSENSETPIQGSFLEGLENLKKEAEEAKAKHSQDALNWNQELENLHSKHTEDFENLKNEAREIITTHVGEAEKWKNEAESAKAQLMSHDIKLQQYLEQEESLKREILSIQEKLAQAQKDLDFFNSAHPALIQETDSLKNDLSSAITESEQAKNRIMELENELGQKENTFSSQDHFEGPANPSELKNLTESSQESLVREIQELKARISALEAELRGHSSIPGIPALNANENQENEEVSSPSIMSTANENDSVSEGSQEGILNTEPLAGMEENPALNPPTYSTGILIETPNNEENSGMNSHLEHQGMGNSTENFLSTEPEISSHEQTQISDSTKEQKPETSEETHEDFNVNTETLYHSEPNPISLPVPETDEPVHSSMESTSPVNEHHEVIEPEIHSDPSENSESLNLTEVNHSHEVSGEPVSNEEPIQETPEMTVENTHSHEEESHFADQVPNSSRNQNIYQEPNYYFRLKGHSEAREVFLVGDFENWEQNHYIMHRGEGEWIFPIHLENGKYLYKFVVDGEWILDPSNSFTEDNIYGTGNSVVFIW